MERDKLKEAIDMIEELIKEYPLDKKHLEKELLFFQKALKDKEKK